MYRSARSPFSALILVASVAGTPSAAAALPEAGEAPRGLEYPDTRRVDRVDTYHGVEVADPYRWLEEDVRESDAVRDWVEAQNGVTLEYLRSIPERDAIEERLTELWNYERYSTPFEEGGRYFFRKNDGLQDQSVLYVQDSLDAEPRVLIDPNTWSEDGTVALTGTAVSDDGRFIAYGVAEAGSDWQTWRVMAIGSGELLEDELSWVKFGGASWTKDGEGFFYSRYPEPEEGEEFQSVALDQKIYYHRLGTPQSEDTLVFERPDLPELGLGGYVTEDGSLLLIPASSGSAGNALFVRRLDERYAAPRLLLGDPENPQHDYFPLGNLGDTLLVQTDDGAPKGRVVAVNLRDPGRESWREVLPEGEQTLRSASLVGGHLIASYMEDAKSRVRVYTTGGEPVRDVDLPGIGTAFGFGGDQDDPETFYVYASFDTPPSIYRYDVATGESTLWRAAEVDFDPADYEVKQVFYNSKDGTRVPMFISHRKGLELDGSNPTLLYGYGGFEVSLTPFFSVTPLAWMEMGGVYALANIRGGGEYGEAWHEAGTKLHKQNVFDDFIAAAEHLIETRYTRPEKLAVQGGSNGGLLVGAVMTQRPELFGAALPAVGVMDMLRYHQFTAGRFWIDDYGSADDPEEFRALRAYSPYHNLEPGTEYPATLVTTADTDDRVVPGHSFKFAARLQHAQAGSDPVLIRIETRAGHGAGTPTSKQIEKAADLWAFLVNELEVELPGGYARRSATPRGE